MRLLKKHFRAIAAGGLYILCNGIIAHIPSWNVRKLLYRMLGMKIGKHSRIMMNTTVMIPWRISIGENSTITERCFLDGRGGLTIGNNVSLAHGSMVITGTHNKHSDIFQYRAEPVVIEDSVWLAMRAMVLNGNVVKQKCIIGAGSVVTPHSVLEEGHIYVGVPATDRGMRRLEEPFSPSPWTVYFR